MNASYQKSMINFINIFNNLALKNAPFSTERKCVLISK